MRRHRGISAVVENMPRAVWHQTEGVWHTVKVLAHARIWVIAVLHAWLVGSVHECIHQRRWCFEATGPLPRRRGRRKGIGRCCSTRPGLVSYQISIAPPARHIEKDKKDGVIRVRSA